MSTYIWECLSSRMLIHQETFKIFSKKVYFFPLSPLMDCFCLCYTCHSKWQHHPAARNALIFKGQGRGADTSRFWWRLHFSPSRRKWNHRASLQLEKCTNCGTKSYSQTSSSHSWSFLGSGKPPWKIQSIGAHGVDDSKGGASPSESVLNWWTKAGQGVAAVPQEVLENDIEVWATYLTPKGEGLHSSKVLPLESRWIPNCETHST